MTDPIKDQKVVLVKFHTVSFDKEQIEGFLEEYGNAEDLDSFMIDQALHNVTDNVCSELERETWSTEEDFEALLIVDDDEEITITQARAARALEEASFGGFEYLP